jgi:glycosyltransferase involved in cell wall biosynthesis
MQPAIPPNRLVSVMHVSTAHPAFDIRIYHKQCRSLAKAGYRVGLIVPHEKDEERAGVRLYALKKRSNRLARMIMGDLSASVRALASNARVFHLHDPELLPVGLLLKLCGKRVIYDVHEDLPRQVLEKDWIHPRLRSLIAKMIETFENFSARCFDAVVAATPHIAARFASINSNTVTINNVPSLQEMGDCAYSTEKESAVCYIGAISLSRGLLEMIGSMESCNATLHLAGILSPPELLQQIQAAAARGVRVEYHGVLDREGVIQLLRRCSVGLVCFHRAPNHLLSQPTKLFEYMSSGIPVVASNFDYWRGIVEQNHCGICVDPLVPTEIGRAIDHLLSNSSEARQMGINGRKLVEKCYSWEREEKKLLHLYEQLSSRFVKPVK